MLKQAHGGWSKATPTNSDLIEFYGEDVAFSVGPAAYHGQPVEFIRDSSGAVAWVRVNGRIARKA